MIPDQKSPKQIKQNLSQKLKQKTYNFETALQRATQILMACGKEFSFVDILSNPDIRETLPTVSNWPTFPQLYIEGELIGGSDIMMDMYQSGELKTLIDAVEI